MPAVERRYLELLNMEGIDEIYPLDQQGQPAIQPPPDPKTEIESAKFQAEQLYKKQELQIKTMLADSKLAVEETQAILNLAKAESLDNRDQIEGYKALLEQIKTQREILKDGFERVSGMENGPGNEGGNEVSEGLQPGTSGEAQG